MLVGANDHAGVVAAAELGQVRQPKLVGLRAG
jgi:hypothetical protein